MGLDSFVVRFDLGPLLQGQTKIAKLKSAYNSLIIVLRGLQCEINLKVLITCLLLVLVVWDGRSTYRKSCTKNLLIWSDFNFGSSFKVKSCFNGFGEFSSWWIQFASVL